MRPCGDAAWQDKFLVAAIDVTQQITYGFIIQVKLEKSGAFKDAAAIIPDRSAETGNTDLVSGHGLRGLNFGDLRRHLFLPAIKRRGGQRTWRNRCCA